MLVKDPALADKDYVSPGLRVVVPDASFPRMRPADRSSHRHPHHRPDVAHLRCADERFPHLRLLNRDEATILHNIALQFAGAAGLEIGSSLGWSSCHVALAGVRLDVIDPAHANPAIRSMVDESLARCGVSERVRLTAGRSPDGVHALAADRRDGWGLFVIDGNDEAPAPARDARTCLSYAQPDCAFVFHDLASPLVAAALRFLQREGFNVLLYQTAQIMGLAWRGRVTPVAHIPDPGVRWQLPRHLVGLPVSGAEFDGHPVGTPPLFIDSLERSRPMAASTEHRLGDASSPRWTLPLLREIPFSEAEQWRPAVCIVSCEIIGPSRNGGIGTSMSGLAEHLAASGCQVTILYTGSVGRPDVAHRKWERRYAELGITLLAISLDELTMLEGPLKDCGFAIPYLVYQFLTARHFDVVHFNDCGGEGSLCLAAKKFGSAFRNTLLVVALHSPSQWVLELNQTLPTSLRLSAHNYAERLSVKAADVLWSPSRYLLDWALRRGFALPEQTFVQQYCLPSQRLGARASDPAGFPDMTRGRTAPPKEIVFFGRLEERKGLRLFCNAIHGLRHELAARKIAVTFLGKAEVCGGLGSLEYIARRSSEWQFPIEALTDLGQPEALTYLRSGGKLAVMPAQADNSPCTVYEALAWGIPFLATRAGGVPDLVDEADRDRVLFECTTAALVTSLRTVLDVGGWIARPSQSQGDARHAWASFHAHAKAFLPKPVAAPKVPPPRVVAIVEARSGIGLRATLDSIAGVGAIHHVIVLNRDGTALPSTAGSFSVQNIDLMVDDPEALDAALAPLTDEVVLLVHAGITIRAEAFAASLVALECADVDGLVPAAEIVANGSRRVVPPLGGHPAFAFFEGVTFTGGLLVRNGPLRRATLGRTLTAEAAFMGLADFCVTRGTDIWPYPEPVFRRPERWIVSTRPLPSRLMAYDECSATDRYYMLAAAYGTPAERIGGRQRRAALAMVNLGLGSVVPFAAWAVRRARGIRVHLALGAIGRLLRRSR